MGANHLFPRTRGINMDLHIKTRGTFSRGKHNRHIWSTTRRVSGSSLWKRQFCKPERRHNCTTICGFSDEQHEHCKGQTIRSADTETGHTTCDRAWETHNTQEAKKQLRKKGVRPWYGQQAMYYNSCPETS